MITNEALDWSSDDESNLRAFFSTETGQRLLPKLLETAPTNLAKGETTEVLIRSGEVRGYSEAARNLLSLAFRPASATVETDQPSSEYPSLTDDAKWADGQKLNQA